MLELINILIITHFKDIKYSYLIKRIYTQLYGFKYSNQILMMFSKVIISI